MDTSHTAPPPVGTAPLGASLRRTTADRLVLGLCGGIARSADLSPIFVRLATVVFAFVLLPFVVAAYLAASLIVPRDDGTALLGKGSRDNRDVIVALLSLAVAAPLILGTASSGIFGGLDAWPAVLAGSALLFGLAIWRPKALFGDRGAATTSWSSGSWSSDGTWTPAQTPRSPRTWTPAAARAASTVTAATAQVDVPTNDETAATEVVDLDKRGGHTVSPGFGDPFHGAVTGPFPDDDPSAVDAPAGEGDTLVRDPGEATADDDRTAIHGGGGGPQGPDGTGFDEPSFAAGPPPGAPLERRRSIALPIFAVLALIPAVFVVAIALGLVSSVWNAWSVMLALMALGAAGGGVAIAFLRRSYLGTGFLVMLAAFFGAGSVAVHQVGPLVDDGVGTRTVTPSTLAELRPAYTLGLGELDIDLRELHLRPGSTTTLRTTLGYGQLRVIVPKGVRVVAAPGSQLPDLTASAGATGATAKTSASAPVIALDVRMKGGQADLLTGTSRYFSNLETLSSMSHGFWGTDDRTQDVRPPVNRP
ncbi:MAG: PspC domain-containing protein [Solirubrobacteraceae bacterium]|nr:PspC domain-containing protein [Patulibacter sp.]